MDSRIYKVWLSLAIGTDNNHARTLYGVFDSAKEIYDADDYSQVKGLRKNTAEALADKSITKAVEICSECDRLGIGIVCIEDELFPARLKAIDKAPFLLYYYGNLKKLDDECIFAVVGTRKVTDRGREISYAFASSFAKSGITVVSGLAAGVDAMGHKGCIDSGGYTVAVLGTAIDEKYPKENRKLYGEIENSGVILSEYYPGSRVNGKYSFPQRNRIIAGLASVVLVCEAGSASGSIITANYGIEQGKRVYAIPRSVGESASSGTNEMLKKGAKLATCPYDLMHEFEYSYPLKVKVVRDGFTMGECEAPPLPPSVFDTPDIQINAFTAQRPTVQKTTAPKTEPKPKQAPKTEIKANPEAKKTEPVIPAGLEGNELAVYSAIDPDYGSTADSLAAATRLGVVEVLTALSMLEIFGHIKAVPGGIYLRV